MENEEENRERKITTRFKPGEFILIDRRFRKTRFRKMSEYIRCVLLEKPLTIIYRDKSMDDMLEELALLRRELTAIGNNLNQAVRQINAAHGDADNRLWLSLMSIISSKVDPAIAQIKDRMQNFSEIWSQKSKPDEASSEQ
ncbi:plasmid mobilization protein [Mucilaginibacter terrae]|nr:plasmid mobilization relaxosome protein MobC [Mucilaginibacter terrae]